MNDKPTSESVLNRYAVKGGSGEGSQSELETIDDHGAFGWLRGIRERAIMMEFRLKDGSVHSFGYAWLRKAIFDPSEGITLDFSGETVKITGRNLDLEPGSRIQLFNGILRHRVTWIREADGAAILAAPENAIIIECCKIGKGSPR